MLRLASAFPPVGLAALTNALPLVWGAGPMLNVTALEAPPPELAVKASTVARPTAARSAAGTCTVKWLLSTKVVGRFCPFHRTTVPAAKLEPLTLSVMVGPPALAVFGVIEAIAGCNPAPDSGARISDRKAPWHGPRRRGQRPEPAPSNGCYPRR